MDVTPQARSILDRLDAELEPPAAPQPNRMLYHYTDAAGVQGIIREGNVWATHYRFMNDRTELTEGAQARPASVSRASGGPKPHADAARPRDRLLGGGSRTRASTRPHVTSSSPRFRRSGTTSASGARTATAEAATPSAYASPGRAATRTKRRSKWARCSSHARTIARTLCAT